MNLMLHRRTVIVLTLLGVAVLLFPFAKRLRCLMQARAHISQLHSLTTVYQAMLYESIRASEMDASAKPMSASSNEELQPLIGTYIESPNIFEVKKSAWCTGAGLAQSKLSGQLGKGSNGWAVFRTRVEDSPGTPVMMDASSNRPGIWTHDTHTLGGVFGSYVVMSFNSQSVRVIQKESDGTIRFEYNGKTHTVDEFHRNVSPLMLPLH